MIGICSYGAYVPLLRMKKEAMGGFGLDERSVANFDEDPITMAVAAGLDCLKGIDPKTGLPHPPQRILNAMDEAHVHMDPFRRAPDQVAGVLETVQEILHISLLMDLI